MSGGDPILWVHDGRVCLGRVFAVRRGFLAELDDGTALGCFPTVKAARTKILFKSGDQLLERPQHRRRHQRRR